MTLAQDMRSAETAAAEIGLTGEILMEAAGAEIARAAVERFGHGRRVLVLSGPGQNGGDGLTAARHLDALGAQVTVGLLADPGRLRGPAALQWQRLAAAPTIARRSLSELSSADCDLVIDAIFGVSLRLPLAGDALRATSFIRDARRPVLAVDLPTGVLADTGEAAEGAVRADLTLALGALKPGHVYWPGAGHCGEVRLAALGIPGPFYPGPPLELVTELPSAALPPRTAPKQAYGDVLVLAGSARYPGAAWLALRGALRGGAGRATLLSVGSVLMRGGALPEAIVQEVPADHGGGIDPERIAPDIFHAADAVAAGPGLGDTARQRDAWRRLLLDVAVPLCLDADALSPFAGEPEALQQRRGPSVLTPHRGEAGRLLGRRVDDSASARLEAAREIAVRSGAVTLLKGYPTFVASPDGQASVLREGGPELAAPGSGDVLTGLLAAQLALCGSAHEAAVRAGFLHGRAGQHLRAAAKARGHLAGEIADALVLAMAES